MPKSKKFITLCKKYGVDPEKVPEILSFEDACAYTGDDPALLPIVDHLPKHQKRLVADYQLSIIAEALNEKKLPDYTDWNEVKYFPWFEVKADKKRPSGFGLSCDDFGFWYTNSYVGVRLCFKERDVAIFFGKHFIALHTDHHLYT